MPVIVLNDVFKIRISSPNSNISGPFSFHKRILYGW